MAEELKPCPFCGGAVQFHSDEDCHGCHYIECSGCKAMFDFSPTTDPENECDSLHELQCGIVHTWNTRAQLPSQGGEAVEVVAYRGKDPDGGEGFVGARWPDAFGEDCIVERLMTVAQHQRILAAANHPADQVADGVVVPRELLERMAYNIAYAVFNLADRKLEDLRPGLVETSDPADSALIAERDIRALLAQGARS